MKISVVIPSRRRYSELHNCLESLALQSVIPAEVLIIENDSRSHYKSKLSKFKHALPIRHLLEKSPGKALARNTGLIAAKEKLIAFLDDDCVPDTNWVSNILKVLSKPNVDVVLGKSIEHSQSLLIQAYTFQYERFFLALRIDLPSNSVRCGGALNTRNFAIKKTFQRDHSIWFDSRYDNFGFAEDTDFGEQLEKAGAKMIYDEKIIVTHHETDKFTSLLKKKFINGRAIFMLKTKGLFHTFKLPKKKQNFIFERIADLIHNKTSIEVLKLMFYIISIIFAYKLGYAYQQSRTRLELARSKIQLNHN